MRSLSSNAGRATLLSLVLLGLALFATTCSAPPSPPVTLTSAPPPTASPTGTPTANDVTLGCFHDLAAPTAEPVSIAPAVTETDYSIGPADATVTLVEYCDFQAPICRSMAAVVSNLIHSHPEDIRFIFRPVPMVDRLDKSELAVQAALAAAGQDHFWEMYDLLFQRLEQWQSLSPGDFEGWLKNNSTGLGLDPARFAADLESEATVTAAQSLYTQAQSFGLVAVPLLLINGQPQPTFSLDYDTLNSNISMLLLAKRQFKDCPTYTIDPARTYTAILHTEKGEVVIELLPERAPLAVNSFVFLARSGWYDDITFHRVIEGQLVQTGDPSGTGRGGPGYYFRDELDTGLKFDTPGMVAMANQGPDTNGSQFFISLSLAPQFDGKYTIFGRVLSGLEVLKQLTPRDIQVNPRAPAGDRLISVEIIEK